jgi:hypothetical protein
MTESRPPEDAPHHGLAEEIREEIAEVVEHVPKPVRWTIARIAWLVAAGIVLVLVLGVVTAGLYLANRTEWVAKELELFVNQALARRSDVVLAVRDLSGNPLTGITLHEPRARFRDRPDEALFAARRVVARYSAWSLLTGRSRVVDLRADSVVVRLARGPDGKLRLPQWKAGPRGGAGRPVQVRVRLDDARVLAPEGLEGVEGLDLDATVRTGGALRVTLDQLAWKQGPYGTRLDRMRGTFESGDSVRVRIRELMGPRLALRGHAAWARGGGDRIVSLEVRELSWRLLARLFQNGAFDVPGRASVAVEARGNREWRGSFKTSLDWDGLEASGTGRLAWNGRRLRVEPLHLAGPAGDLRGWVTYEAAGWAVGGDVDRGDPSTWGPLKMPGWPEGRLHGRFRYAVDTRTRGRPSSDLTARLGGSVLGGWRVDSAQVEVAFPWGSPVSFQVTGKRRGGRFDLDALADPEGWSGEYRVTSLPLEEWPDGRAMGLRGALGSGAGTVRADDQGLWVTGELSGSGSEWIGLRAAGWRLEGVDGRLLPTPALSARARLADLDYLGVHFDSAAVAFALGDQVAAINRVEAWAGDTLVTADGHARWERSQWELELDHAGMRSTRFAWSAEPPVRLTGDPNGVAFERFTARDGAARLEIGGRWAAPGGRYDWRLRGTGLDLARLGLPADWALGGRADVGLDVDGASGDPRWRFTADLSRPASRGHVTDSAHVVLNGAPGRAELTEGLFALRGGRLTARLRADGMARAWPDTLTPDGVQAWLADAERWDGSVRADALPLDRAASLFPSAQGFAGSLSGGLEIRGRPSRPVLEADLRVNAPRWRDFLGDRLEARVGFASDRLTVEELRLTHRALTSTATGAMPLQLALGRRPSVPEAPMEWRVDIPGGDLAVVPFIVPQVASARGRLEARASLTGTARHPRLDGFVRVREGAVRLEGREEVLEGLAADFRLSETRVTLDSLSARQGLRGRVRASGAVDLEGLSLGGYRFDLDLRDFTAVEQGLYVAAFDGDFVVTDGPKVKGQTLPRVAGTVRLDRAAVLFDFANQTEIQRLAATTVPLFWVYRVQVEASDELHWQPPNGDIEFSADLTVEQTPESLLVFGDMRALRGTYWFLSNRFEVERADLTFDNVNGVDPMLDVSATTRMDARPDELVGALTVGRSESRPTTHIVTATIEGRSSKPTITLSDDQGAWDQPRILRELTLGRLGGVAGIGDPLDNYVTRALNRTLSAEMSRLFQGYVNEWALERQRGGLFTGEGDVVATVGVPVGRNVSLRYRRRLGAEGSGDAVRGSTEDLFDQNLEAEYRLSRFIYMTTEWVSRRGISGSTTSSEKQDINVNLKARWEY